MNLEYEKVNEIGLARFTNAEFIYFITRVVELLIAMQEKEDEGDDGEEDLPSVQSAEPRAAADGVPALYIPQEMIDAVKEALAKMQNLTKESRANAITKQLEIIDRRRDSLAAFVLEAIKRAADMFSEAEELALVLALQTAMKPYAGIGKDPQKQETVNIRGMVADIRKPQFAPIITSMGIETQVNLLEEENERFAQLASQRSQDDSDTKKLETNKELRAQLTTLYNAIADHAFAANLLHGTDETANFIKDLNSHIEETVEDYNRRGPNDDEEEGEDDTPTDETPGTETPENPDGETPEEPDDRPVVQ